MPYYLCYNNAQKFSYESASPPPLLLSISKMVYILRLESGTS